MYFISEIKLYNKIYKREREREGEQGEREESKVRGRERKGRGEIAFVSKSQIYLSI